MWQYSVLYTIDNGLFTSGNFLFLTKNHLRACGV